jgi:hypothetical protein
MRTAKWASRIGTVFYVLWGIFHLVAANAVYALAEQSTGMVRARLLQDGLKTNGDATCSSRQLPRWASRFSLAPQDCEPEPEICSKHAVGYAASASLRWLTHLTQIPDEQSRPPRSRSVMHW